MEISTLLAQSIAATVLKIPEKFTVRARRIYSLSPLAEEAQMNYLVGQ